MNIDTILSIILAVIALPVFATPLPSNEHNMPSANGNTTTRSSNSTMAGTATSTNLHTPQSPSISMPIPQSLSREEARVQMSNILAATVQTLTPVEREAIQALITLLAYPSSPNAVSAEPNTTVLRSDENSASNSTATTNTTTNTNTTIETHQFSKRYRNDLRYLSASLLVSATTSLSQARNITLLIENAKADNPSNPQIWWDNGRINTVYGIKCLGRAHWEIAHDMMTLAERFWGYQRVCERFNKGCNEGKTCMPENVFNYGWD